jgi:hypothetical protein
VDNPDETVQVFPETCADCGAGLADGADADIMTALRDAMTHNPWTPPFPAPT